MALVADGQDITLDGTLERVVFKNDETGWTVARFELGSHQITTVVGELLGISEGLPLRLRGQWVEDKKFGRQFKVTSYALRSPETLVGIERFIGAAGIQGIGPEMAKRLVKKFGMETLEVIDREPHRLTEVVGIGAARASTLSKAFADHRHVQDMMVFLHGIGVSASLAPRIIKRYGKDAVSLIRANPYRLAHEIRGIGFRTADAYAQKLGIARDAPERIEAGLLHALETAAEDGHMHMPDELLITQTAELLGIAQELIAPRLGALQLAGRVIRESLGDRGPCTELPWAFDAEADAAARLAELVNTPHRASSLDVGASIHAFEAGTNIQLAGQQRRAVEAAMLDKCVVITGGPGVGKTTIVKAIVNLAKLTKKRIALGAPTGRAAKRLGEATQHEAMTIHRLLEYQPHENGFARKPENPLEIDLLVIDETSMVDAQLFKAVMAALPAAAQLVLVGDVDQLPSVGAGSVLSDVIQSGAATVIRLTEIFRQAQASKIVVSAHRINHGELPDLDTPAGANTDFFFIGRDDPEAARQTIIELVSERIPTRFGFNAVTEVQVLAPMHRGELGTAMLNKSLQDKLNPAITGQLELVRGERTFRRGDKVMQLKNDYDKNVFNGDIGVITGITAENVVSVEIDGRIATYKREELDQLVHAYAVSIHKSQGSEYPAIVIPLGTQHFMMLQRSLLYTAVTRGKRLVVIVGSRRAVQMAVRNAEARQRFTWFAERVRAAVTESMR